VAVVIGRAGSGKTWALGLAREAFELDGYRVLGTAPTGIATVGLADEGFTNTATIDRLLLDLGRGQTPTGKRCSRQKRQSKTGFGENWPMRSDGLTASTWLAAPPLASAPA
jgi:hypothetical protein